jgi:hypothetical protein
MVLSRADRLSFDADRNKIGPISQLRAVLPADLPRIVALGLYPLLGQLTAVEPCVNGPLRLSCSECLLSWVIVST